VPILDLCIIANELIERNRLGGSRFCFRVIGEGRMAEIHLSVACDPRSQPQLELQKIANRCCTISLGQYAARLAFRQSMVIGLCSRFNLSGMSPVRTNRRPPTPPS
jgi:hypothetical protein